MYQAYKEHFRPISRLPGIFQLRCSGSLQRQHAQNDGLWVKQTCPIRETRPSKQTTLFWLTLSLSYFCPASCAPKLIYSIHNAHCQAFRIDLRPPVRLDIVSWSRIASSWSIPPTSDQKKSLIYTQATSDELKEHSERADLWSNRWMPLSLEIQF